MSEPTELIGRLGTQEIAPNAIIQPKTPSEFETFPYSNNPNLRFDGYWTIKSDSELKEQRLAENGTYDYGDNVSVEANWKKKVQTHIWCPGEEGELHAGDDLISHVHVYGGSDGDVNHSFEFFRTNETATFEISGATNRVIRVSGDRTYTFLGWAHSLPSVYSISSSQLCEDTNLVYSIYPQFSPNFLKEEWAYFLYGTEINVIVKTNITDLNNGSNCYNYTMYGKNPEQKIFSTKSFSIDASDFGKSFVCEPCNQTIGIYEFKGWVLRDYDGTTVPIDLMTEEAITPNIFACYNPIVLTAVYVVSGTTYTITYYSGLPPVE